MPNHTAETTLNFLGVSSLIGRILMDGATDCGDITIKDNHDGSITVRADLISQADMDEILLGA